MGRVRGMRTIWSPPSFERHAGGIRTVLNCTVLYCIVLRYMSAMLVRAYCTVPYCTDMSRSSALLVSVCESHSLWSWAAAATHKDTLEGANIRSRLCLWHWASISICYRTVAHTHACIDTHVFWARSDP